MTKPMTKESAIAAIRMIADAIVDAVKVAGPIGAPAGTLYAALMPHGATLDQFEQLMRLLVAAGKVRKAGDLYFSTGA